MALHPDLEDLADQDFVLLSTFRRNGEAVRTAVWVARVGDHLVVSTPDGTGKLKRLAHTSHVTVQACSRRGTPLDGAPEVSASASVSRADGIRRSAEEALKAKYGIQWRIAMLIERVVRRGRQVARPVILIEEPDRFSAEAATWDEKPGAVERATTIAAAIRSSISLSPNASALEIGGGTGLLSRALADDIGTAVVTDVAPGMVEAATNALDDPRYARWRAERFDVESDDLPSERYDLVLSQLALHHMGDVAAVLARAFTLLRQGGYIAVADLEHDPDGGFHRHVHDFHGHHGFTREALVGWLEEAGFADVCIEVAGQATKDVDGDERHFPILLATGRRPLT